MLAQRECRLRPKDSDRFTRRRLPHVLERIFCSIEGAVPFEALAAHAPSVSHKEKVVVRSNPIAWRRWLSAGCRHSPDIPVSLDSIFTIQRAASQGPPVSLETIMSGKAFPATDLIDSLEARRKLIVDSRTRLLPSGMSLTSSGRRTRQSTS